MSKRKKTPSVKKKNPVLWVTGGGTGGHIFAGVSIAQAWPGFPKSVEFIGARGGLEEKLVPKTGLKLSTIRLGALNRVSLRTRIETLMRFPFVFFKVLGWLLIERPSVVIGVGGYASGPVVLLAALLGWIWGCKTAILEQNAAVGLTNRVLGRVVDQVFAAFPGIEAQFAGQEVCVCGGPVRKEITPVPTAAGVLPFRILVFGGSQGARGINRLVVEALEHLGGERTQIEILLQTGPKEFEAVKKKVPKTVQVVSFIDQMQEEYRKASVVICRAGSGTLSELAAVGRAAVLVPFPAASDDHQTRNAEIFVRRGAAILMPEKTSSGKDLAKQILKLLHSPEKITQLENNIRALHPGDAASTIVRHLQADLV